MDNARMEVEALLDSLLYEWEQYSTRVLLWQRDKSVALHTERVEDVRKQIEDRLLSKTPGEFAGLSPVEQMEAIWAPDRFK